MLVSHRIRTDFELEHFPLTKSKWRIGTGPTRLTAHEIEGLRTAASTSASDSESGNLFCCVNAKQAPIRQQSTIARITSARTEVNR